MPNYRQNTSLRANALVTLRQQMADFARAEKLRKLRDDRHLSQEDAAHEIGVSVKSLRAWEKGGGIRWANAKTVAAFYGVDPETLVSRERDGGGPTPDVLGTFSRSDSELLREVASQVAQLASSTSALRSQVRELSRKIPEPGEGSADQ